LDIYRTEDEQVESLKKWWAENGKSAVFGVVLGLSAIFGWREWQDYTMERAVGASQLYQQMVIAARDNDTATLRDKAQEITTLFKRTAYAVFARMTLAKLAVEDGDLEGAESHLRWALANAPGDSLHHVIRLRLARVLMAEDKLDGAQDLLVAATSRGEFAHRYRELEGDLLRRKNQVEEARKAYREALRLAEASGQDTTLLDMKLDDLGRN